jgi:protein MpaA
MNNTDRLTNDPEAYINYFSKIAKMRKFHNHKDTVFSKKKQGASTLLITAGIHGNEKAGPLALSTFLKKHDDYGNHSIYIVPLLNPDGFEHNRRENEQGRDLNRAFNKNLKNDNTDFLEDLIFSISPDLVVNLHEDGVHDGFYLYIPLEEMLDIAEQVLNKVKKVMPANKNKSIFGTKAEGGIIVQDPDDEDPKNQNSFEHFCFRHGFPYITLETSSKTYLKTRVAALTLALEAVLGI